MHPHSPNCILHPKKLPLPVIYHPHLYIPINIPRKVYLSKPYPCRQTICCYNPSFTYVGLYIMICSILFALVCAIPGLPQDVSTVLCGILEITQGSTVLAASAFPLASKTALILACTSFGGISAFLQTLQVTKKSGLSMIYYFVVKCICGCMTGFAMYLLLV